MERIKQTINVLRSTYSNKIKPYLKDPLFLNKWVISDIFIAPPDPNRKTVWTAQGYRTLAGRNNEDGADMHMYTQDMLQFINPKGSQTSNYEYKLKENTQEARNLIINALSNGSMRTDLQSCMDNFIEESAQGLFYYGKATFEVVCVKTDEGVISSLKFHSVYSPSIRRILGIYVQIIPWKAAKFARIKAGIKIIPSKSILYIEFPRKLGGKRAYRKIVRDLGFISKELLPPFHLESLKNQNNVGFNFSEYIWQRYIMKGKITRRYGWDQRKHNDSDILEYYSIYRHLEFAKSQATIREHILIKLNTKLKDDPISLSNTIVCENTLSSSDVDEEFKKLKLGDTEFTELWKRTSSY